MTKHEVIEDIVRRFETLGGSLYGGEAVTQLEHALQTAMLAQREGATAELVAAALLHDIGHLLHELPDDAPDQGVDDCHEDSGYQFLLGRFPEATTQPVRLHVPAKRYLCATDPAYDSQLSEPSRVSLRLQGGPMNEDEVRVFQAEPFAEDAVRLRRWDDEAKIVGLQTPPLSAFLDALHAAAMPVDNGS